jgi:hypothetical protein
LTATATVIITVRMTMANTLVIHPSLAPLVTETGTPVRFWYIHTATKPAAMAQMMKSMVSIESSRMDKAAAAKAMRSATGLAKDTRGSMKAPKWGGGGGVLGVSTINGSSKVGFPHLWQKRAPSTN